MKKRTIAVLTENKSGVLGDVSRMFSARGFNIHSLTVGETEDKTISRMTVTTSGDDQIIDQIIKQLNKIVDVIEIVDLTDQEVVSRETALIKVKSKKTIRHEILTVIDNIDEARVNYIDPDNGNIVIEITASERKVNELIKLLSSYSPVEVVRSGVIAISREIEVGAKLRAAKKMLIK